MIIVYVLLALSAFQEVIANEWKCEEDPINPKTKEELDAIAVENKIKKKETFQVNYFDFEVTTCVYIEVII